MKQKEQIDKLEDQYNSPKSKIKNAMTEQNLNSDLALDQSIQKKLSKIKNHKLRNHVLQRIKNPDEQFYNSIKTSQHSALISQFTDNDKGSKTAKKEQKKYKIKDDILKILDESEKKQNLQNSLERSGKSQDKRLIETQIPMFVHASNPNLMWNKSSRKVLMSEYERNELIRMQSKQRYLSQSVEITANQNQFDVQQKINENKPNIFESLQTTFQGNSKSPQFIKKQILSNKQLNSKSNIILFNFNYIEKYDQMDTLNFHLNNYQDHTIVIENQNQEDQGYVKHRKEQDLIRNIKNLKELQHKLEFDKSRKSLYKKFLLDQIDLNQRVNNYSMTLERIRDQADQINTIQMARNQYMNQLSNSKQENQQLKEFIKSQIQEKKHEDKRKKKLFKSLGKEINLLDKLENEKDRLKATKFRLNQVENKLDCVKLWEDQNIRKHEEQIDNYLRENRSRCFLDLHDFQYQAKNDSILTIINQSGFQNNSKKVDFLKQSSRDNLKNRINSSEKVKLVKSNKFEQNF